MFLPSVAPSSRRPALLPRRCKILAQARLAGRLPRPPTSTLLPRRRQSPAPDSPRRQNPPRRKPPAAAPHTDQSRRSPRLAPPARAPCSSPNLLPLELTTPERPCFPVRSGSSRRPLTPWRNGPATGRQTRRHKGLRTRGEDYSRSRRLGNCGWAGPVDFGGSLDPPFRGNIPFRWTGPSTSIATKHK
jgi:hypothetical protein